MTSAYPKTPIQRALCICNRILSFAWLQLLMPVLVPISGFRFDRMVRSLLPAGSPVLGYLCAKSVSLARCEEGRSRSSWPPPPTQVKLPPQCAAHAGISKWFDHCLFTDDFWSNRFERQFVHLKATEYPGNPLLSVLDHGEFASMVGRAMQIDGGEALRAMKSGRGQASRVPFEEYLRGSSLILSTADRFNPALAQLSLELASKHFFHTFCVGYLTPPHEWARRPHNDDQDVIIVQIWGKKEWQLFESPVSLIYREEMIGKAAPIPAHLKVVKRLTLHAGDVLYIPRGMVHDAKALDESSLHITITVPTFDLNHGVSFAELARELLPQVPAARQLRRAVTRHAPGQLSDAQLREAGHAVLQAVTANSVRSFVAHKSRMHSNEQAMATRRCLEPVPDSSVLHPASLLKAPADLDRVVDWAARKLTLRCGDKKLSIGATEDRLRWVDALLCAPDGVAMQRLPMDDGFEAVCLATLLAKQGLIEARTPELGATVSWDRPLTALGQRIKACFAEP